MTTRIDVDIFDSRDIESRIDELENLIAPFDDEDDSRTDDERDEDDDLMADEREELANLKELRDDVSHPEWDFGLTFIRDGYFEQYAQEFAADIGAISDDASWPATCIDWEKAADELKMDYTSVDFDGETYYYRS